MLVKKELIITSILRDMRWHSITFIRIEHPVSIGGLLKLTEKHFSTIGIVLPIILVKNV